MKTNYLNLALKTAIVMIGILLIGEAIAYFLKEGETTFLIGHFSILISLMIAWAVFFKQRMLWEVDHGKIFYREWMTYRHPWLLSTLLLRINWLVCGILLFAYFLCFNECMASLFAQLPFPWLLLFKWPLLISAIILAVTTTIMHILRGKAIRMIVD